MEQPVPSHIDLNKLPQHVAIIMDGNGRWAKNRGMARTFGHKNAMKAVRSTIEVCGELKIPHLTLYAFSTENWNRPTAEVNILFSLLVETLKKEKAKLEKEGIKLQTIGDLNRFPKKVVKELENVKKATEHNNNTVLHLALNYGAKSEILLATKTIAEKVQNGYLTPDEINEELFEKHLYTRDTPAVDLMIRTSGEHRISNFLLWQVAYAELYFCDTLWPDFRKDDFYKALESYQKRERRFGKTGEQIIKTNKT